MIDYMTRQWQLWGKKTQDNLATKKVAVVGCGGLGCSIGIALGGLGLGRIDLIDFDQISLHNIHRQIAFDLEDEERFKADVLKETIQKRYDKTIVQSYIASFAEFGATTIQNYDLIFDATDNIQARADIDQYCKDRNTPWVYGSVEKFYGQVCFMDKAKFDEFFKIIQNEPQGITAGMVMHIASFQVLLGMRYLAELPIQKDKLYHFSFDEFGVFNHKQFSLKA
ncbi:MAG: thiamine biosynthesis protein ThiF [Epsilonproteobacteria bacterium]|nr:MAG: thiamine biosynthesis protein ThiF [Campylobacterota bacterium]